MLVGDDVKKVAEAADYAKKLIGCKIMQNKPYYRTAGHVQVRLAPVLALQCDPAFTALCKSLT